MINLQKNEFTIEVLKYYRYNINYYEENNIVAYKNTKEEKQKMQKNEDFEKKMEKNKALNTENEISNVKEKLAASDTKISEEKEDITEEKKVSSANSVGKEKSPKVEKETKVDEATVIEKIKDFISKIIAMQEESLKVSDDEENSEKTVSKKTKTSAVKKASEPQYMIEYYDLPYRYNETVVKILAQTPKKMFVYWDVSDNDRKKYIETFGDDFFEKTYPVLLLYNEDKQYVKEIPINDFANSWYIDIDDPKNKYTIQLGRKFKYKDEFINIAKLEENNIILKTHYLPFANSNILEIPNDHVLLEELPDYITFRNVKTNEETYISVKSFKDVFGNNYSVKGFYEEQCKDEISEGMFDMANPSSKLSSSAFK